MTQETTTKNEKAQKRSLVSTDYRTISYVTGPLVFVSNVHDVAYNEMVAIRMPDGKERSGQVLEVSGDIAVIQVFEGRSRRLKPRQQLRKLRRIAAQLLEVAREAGQPAEHRVL